MIIIDYAKCKNFLSYGNAWTIFNLSTHKATLIRGKNGHGKSVILDLILFALYGKPYRNINKPQLVNSTNQNNMLVELGMRIGADEYVITRGMKPAVFDIFKNGNLIEQEAATRDYQGFLESQILKVSERTFKQIAVLGSASYVPFMKLTAIQRRELVESILDIEIFSRMNIVLRDRMAATKDELTRIGHRVDLKKTEAQAQQKLIKVMQENTKSRVVEYENKHAELLLVLANFSVKKIACDEELALIDTVEPSFDSKQYEELNTKASSMRLEIKTNTKRIDNLMKLDDCPTCLQKVDHSHIDAVNSRLTDDVKVLKKSLSNFDAQIKAMDLEKDALYTHQNKRKVITDKIIVLGHDVESTRKQLSDIDSTIKSILSNTDDVNTEQDKLKVIGGEAIKLIERKNTLTEEQHLQDVAQQLLKDTGVKTAVVREYLPILNTLINKYLAMFDFFVDFTLNESFDEVIKSRGRDVFTYSSFSEGEKRRIDLAILMAFRQLAALKNSAKTNILIFDEIVDGAFDLDARAAFNDLLNQIPNSNIIVISHADASTEQYDRVIQVEKKNDFSVYSVVE